MMDISTLISWLPLCLIFLVPLMSGVGGVFENEFVRLWMVYVIVSLSWICLGWERWQNKTQMYSPPKGLLFWLGIWLLSMLAAGIWGLSFWDSLIGRYGLWLTSILSRVVWLGLAYLSFSAYVISGKEWTEKGALAIISSLILLVLQDVNWILNREAWLSDRWIATFRNPNQLGFYLSLVTVYCGGLFLTSRDLMIKWLGFAGLILGMGGIILSQSRGSWISIGVVGIMAGMWLLSKGKRKTLLLAIVCLAIIGWLFSTVIYQRVQWTLSPQTNRVSHQIRLQEWQTVWQIWKDHPWTGIGPENLDLIYPRYRSVQQNLIEEEWQWRTVITRNYWLELLVTTGPLGILGYLGIFGWVVWRAPRNRQTLPWLMVLGTFYVHSFFYAPNTATLVLFWTSLGVVAAKGRTRFKSVNFAGVLARRVEGGVNQKLYSNYLKFSPLNAKFAFRVTGVFLVCLGVVFICLTTIVGRSEYLAWQSLTKLNSDHAASYRLMEKAYSLNPMFDKNLRQWILVHEEILRKNEADNKEKLTADYSRLLKALESRNENDIENLKTLTSGYMRLAGFSGDRIYYHSALRWGSELLKIDPTSPGSWDTVGIVYLDMQEFEQALKIFTYIIDDLKPDYPLAYFHIAEVYKQLGNVEKFNEFHQKGVIFNNE